MSIQTLAALKAKFETGDQPTAADFVDLIDSFLHAGLANFPDPLPAVSGAALLDIGSALPDPLPAVSGELLTNINPQEYNLPAGMPIPSYATATTFVLNGDWTVSAAGEAGRVFLVDRRVRLKINDSYFYTDVKEANFSAGVSTVTLFDAMPGSPIQECAVSVIRPVVSGGGVSPATLGLAIPRSYLAGLTLSTTGASTAMAVAAGQCVDSNNAAVMSLPAFSKTTAAWALGTGNGGLDAGAIANNAWHHFFVIRRPDTGVVDVLFSLSATTPTLPANFTQFRRIGSGKTNGSGQWIEFVQDGDYFIWKASVLDVTAVNPGTAAVLRTLSVPPGVNVEANFQAIILAAGTTTAADVYLSDPAQNDEAPAAGTFFDTGRAINVAGGVGVAGSRFRIRTNSSAQIRTRFTYTDANVTFYLRTLGWYDPRGRNN